MRSLCLAIALTLTLLTGCGGDSAAHDRGPTRDAAVDGGSHEKDAGRGGSGTGGTAGHHEGAAGHAGSAGSAGSPDDAGDAAIDAAVAQDDAGTEPLVDGGTGCVGPEGEALMTAASVGLPTKGLVLWLRGDRGVYKTASDRVCAWVDQSGHGNVLRDPSSPPLWVAAGLGGQAAIHFDAANTYLTESGVLGIAPTSGRTFVAVTKLVNTTGRFAAVQQGKSGSGGTYAFIDANTFNTTGSLEGAYLTNNAYDTTLATSTSPRIHLLAFSTFAPGTAVLSAMSYRVNGAVQSLTRTPGGSPIGAPGVIEDFSSADFTLVGAGPDAYVAEVLVYDRALTTSERTSTEAALKSRYGIP